MREIVVTYLLATATICAFLLLLGDRLTFGWSPEHKTARVLTDSIKYSLPERTSRFVTDAFAVDGLLLLQGGWEPDSLELDIPVSPDAPSAVNYTLRVPAGPPLGFSLSLGSAGGREYRLVYEETSDMYAEVRVFHGYGDEQSDVHQGRMPTHYRRPRSKLPVSIEHDSPTVRWRIGLQSGHCELDHPLERMSYALSPTGHNRVVLVDDIAVTFAAADRSGSERVFENFDYSPISYPLNKKLGLSTESRTYSVLTTVLFFLLAAAIDGLVTHVYRRRWRRVLSVSTLSLLILPTQAVAWLVMRSILDLSILLYYTCFGFLCVACVIRVLRAGVVRQHQRPDPSRLRTMFLKPIALYLGFIASIALIDTVDGAFSNYFIMASTFVLVATSIVILAPGFRSHPACVQTSMLELLIPQLFLVHVLGVFHPGVGAGLFLSQAMVPWLIAAAVAVQTQWGRSAVTRYAIMGCCVLGISVSVEVTLRDNPWLETVLDVDTQVQETSWDVAGTTSLLGSVTSRDEHVFYGTAFPTHKPPDTFRVVCLGSSSTAGTGASIPETKSYPAVLERRLRLRSSVPVEVINGGINGSPLFQLFVYLDEVLLPLDPDLVILYFGANSDTPWSRQLYSDIKREVDQAPFIRTNEELWAARLLRWNPRWLIRLFLGAAHARTFVGVVLAATDPKYITEGLLYRSAYQGDLASMQRTTLEIVDLCADRCVPLVLIPEIERWSALEPQRPNPVRTCYEAAARQRRDADVFYANLYSSFGPVEVDSYLVDSMHMNDEGYVYLASVIEEALESFGLLHCDESGQRSDSERNPRARLDDLRKLQSVVLDVEPATP